MSVVKRCTFEMVLLKVISLTVCVLTYVPTSVIGGHLGFQSQYLLRCFPAIFICIPTMHYFTLSVWIAKGKEKNTI